MPRYLLPGSSSHPRYSNYRWHSRPQKGVRVELSKAELKVDEATVLFDLLFLSLQRPNTKASLGKFPVQLLREVIRLKERYQYDWLGNNLWMLFY